MNEEQGPTEHSRVENTGDDVDRLVRRSSQDDCLLSQSRGRDLSDNGVSGWANGTVVDEIEYNKQRAHSHRRFGGSMET